MSLVKPDLTQTSDQVSPGTYKVRIKDAKIGEWEAKDGKPATPYINWRMETFGEEQTKNNGRAVFWRTATAGKGAFQLQNLYKAATGEKLDGEFDTDQLLGKEIQVTVAERNGYTDIQAVKSLG